MLGAALHLPLQLLDFALLLLEGGLLLELRADEGVVAGHRLGGRAFVAEEVQVGADRRAARGGLERFAVVLQLAGRGGLNRRAAGHLAERVDGGVAAVEVERLAGLIRHGVP